jgi:subtilisin family serine protease
MPSPTGTRARALACAPLLLVLALVAFPRPVSAQWAQPFKSERYENDANLEKVAPALLDARRTLQRGLSRAQAQRALPPSVPLRAGRPEVDVRLGGPATADVVAALLDAGLEVGEVHEDMGRVIGTCDPLALDRIAAVPQVRSVQPNYRPLLGVGAVTSQADTVIRAAQARAQLGVDGSGVPIGVLSDSFDAIGGGVASGGGCQRTVQGTTSQDTGDLPSSVKVLQDLDGQSDEGRAMAELIHDLAPGSPLLFHTAFTSEPGFAAGIDALRQCGAKVIVDDVIYFAEPMFQDGVVAQAAQRAVDAGVPYFSSAGNYGRVGIDEEYVDGMPGDPDNDFHLFGPGNQVAGISIPNGCGVRLVLQWAEPFDGMLGPGASSDFDVALFDCSGGSCTVIPGAVSDAAQGCSLQGGGPGGDPIEILELPAAFGGQRTVGVAVNRVCGTTTRFRIAVTPSDGCSLASAGYVFDPSIFKDAQIYGHAAAAGVVAVAAVDYREIAQGGDRQAPSNVVNVERFSSLGGVLPIFYDGAGAPLPGGVQLRAKPELAAPDGTNTTFFVGDADGDGFPNFFGTSAAAPHAAAVAALIRERNPALSPSGVLGALTATAIDIESPGYDFLSGFGLVDALDAVAAATPQGPALGVLENPQSNGFQSGVGLVSGWVCAANAVKYQVDDGPLRDAAYGTSRADTAGVCGDANNGFGALFNWNLLGDGPHTLRAFADGVEIGSATFEVATLGAPFLTGLVGQYAVPDFPAEGDFTLLVWQEASQNFVIADTTAGESQASPPLAAPLATALGVLENPSDGSSQSGIGVISGWVCSAGQVTVSIDGGAPLPAAYGTSRLDTVGACGDANNGFGRLINWALLGDGEHTITAFADGMPFAQGAFTVTTLGTTFLTGVDAEYKLLDFAGRDVFVRWQEGQQNFVIVGTE